MRGDVDYGPGQSIDSLIASMAERDETLVEDMQASRRRRADRAATEGVKSLKSLRLSRGLSQADLASAVGMQQPHIARIEKGNNCPTLQTCRRLAMALGVDMNTLNEHMPQVSDSVEVAS
jgi:DNA-binding XRE family transcriptional regulator